MKFTTLWQGKFLSVISPVDYPYECVHEQNSAMVIPYLVNIDKYVFRYEQCPPYMVKTGMTENWYTLVSGGIEEGESSLQTILRELKEEAGIEITDFDETTIIESIPIFKCADTLASIYFLDVYGYSMGSAEGDGTHYEEESKAVLLTFEELEYIIKEEPNYDLLLYMAYLQIKQGRK
jgi:8-oxo-dGTP pyrophosphatase MutT (NUDIX family)